MPDMPINQAAGLLGLTPPDGARLVAMVSHGDDKTELPLLWQLCTSMVDLGYGVTVLDATKAESDQNPGLAQLLDYHFGSTALESDQPEWNTVPAASGVQALCNLNAHPALQLQRIGHLFPPGGMVVLYAGVDALVKLLANSEVKPLLCVSSEKNSLLTSYLALKRLLLKGGMEPTILNMMRETEGGRASGSASAASSLAECARNFLGYEVNTIQLETPVGQAQQGAQMRRLVTRLLESSLGLQAASAGQSVHSGMAWSGQGRSH